MKNKKSYLTIFLKTIETTGNKLPHPATLFLILALIVLLLSYVASVLGFSAVNPVNGEPIPTVNLLSSSGIRKILSNLVTNFTSFAPLGVVIVAMLGIGVAESSGLIEAALKLFVLKTPRRFLTFAIVLAGVMSNIAADVGYVLLIPLAGIIFASLKRNPLIGMAAAFAGVSGGYSANLVIGTLDPLLGGISTESARILDPNYEVFATANYYFMLASTFLISIIGTFITEKIVAPRFDYDFSNENDVIYSGLSELERRGLRYTLLSILCMSGIVALGILIPNGPLRSPDGNFLNSPILRDSIAFIFLFFVVSGLVYGFVTGKFKSDTDAVNGISDSVKTLATYIVLCFIAAQFIAYFKWSNLGRILSVKGADFLISLNIGTIPLAISLIILAALINLVIGSASAKWALIAPVFVPMFMQLNFTPEFTQMLYRIGDSCTNLISPMMSYFALIIAYFQKYDKNANIGTIVSIMLPYSIFFLVGWTLFAIVWIIFDIPLGPGTNLFLN